MSATSVPSSSNQRLQLSFLLNDVAVSYKIEFPDGTTLQKKGNDLVTSLSLKEKTEKINKIHGLFLETDLRSATIEYANGVTSEYVPPKPKSWVGINKDTIKGIVVGAIATAVIGVGLFRYFSSKK